MKSSKRLAVLAGLGACALSLAACSSTLGPVAVLDALGNNYAHCERTVTYTAAVGPLNPASGGNITGTVRCPAKADTEPAERRAETPAPES